MKLYEIGQTYIKIDLQPDEIFLAYLKKYLLSTGKLYSQEYLKKELFEGKFYFKVEFDEGSLKSKLRLFGKISVSAFAAYGGVRAGMDYIVKDTQIMSGHIIEALKTENQVNAQLITRVEKRLGIPGKIKRVFDTIDYLNRERDNLSPNEQSNLIDKINRSVINLVILLDEPERQIIINLVNESGFPVVQDVNRFNLFYDRYAIREDDENLVVEDNID